MIAPSFLTAVISSMVMAIGGLFLIFPPTRWIIKKVIPKPGEGPSEKIQQKGFFTMKFWGKGKAEDGSLKVITGGLDAMQGDPGYFQTAKFISEAGIACLSSDKGGHSGSGFVGGVLTPSTVRS